MDTFLTKSSKKTTPLNSKRLQTCAVTNSRFPTPPNNTQYGLPHNLAGKSATSVAKCLAKNKTPQPKSKARARTFSKTDISPKNLDPNMNASMAQFDKMDKKIEQSSANLAKTIADQSNEFHKKLVEQSDDLKEDQTKRFKEFENNLGDKMEGMKADIDDI